MNRNLQSIEEFKEILHDALTCRAVQDYAVREAAMIEVLIESMELQQLGLSEGELSGSKEAMKTTILNLKQALKAHKKIKIKVRA